MARICPFLAVESDGRTAVAGYDADHRCFALEAPDPLPRSQQRSVCLELAYTSCERYLAAVERHARDAAWARPAPDAEIVSTRLTVSVDVRRSGAPGPGAGLGARRWAVGGTLAVVGVAAVAAGVAGALGSLDGNRGVLTSTAPSAATSGVGGPVVASPRPTASAPSTRRPSPTAAVTRTPRPTAQPTPRGTSTPLPQPQTYVVQAGDTLNGIATRFGTTVAAIQQANGLGGSEVILVGQVLVIP